MCALVCVLARTFMCMHVYRYVYECVQGYVCTSVYVCVYTYAYMSVVWLCMCMHMHVHIFK